MNLPYRWALGGMRDTPPTILTEWKWILVLTSSGREGKGWKRDWFCTFEGIILSCLKWKMRLFPEGLHSSPCSYLHSQFLQFFLFLPSFVSPNYPLKAMYFSTPDTTVDAFAYSTWQYNDYHSCYVKQLFY